ncbi:MAG TPA: PAC2 family protein, partial [Actinomycetota bacterium]|nr:PAC2 family protein [Actinomycetota bacterium]
GPEPDYGWARFRGALIELALQLGVVQSVCLGAIPAMVPHTRPAPIIMTGADRRPRDTDPPLPAEHLRVPAAAVNLVELSLAEAGIPGVGFWAQVPHYVGGAYAAGALELVRRVADHLGVDVPTADLEEQARVERERLDEIVSARPEAKAYLERLEDAQQMAPPGGDIAGEVERFLREVTGERKNPFEDQ